MKIMYAAALVAGAGGLCGCSSDDTTTRVGTSYDYRGTDTTASTDRNNLATSPFGTGQITHPDHDTWPTETRRSEAVSTSPFGTGAERDQVTYQRDMPYSAGSADARLLSILHAKNQEEIKIGRLAKERGQSQAVRDYGAQLVRDHSNNDAQVVATARKAGISLMSADDVQRMLHREKGESMPPRDAYLELREKNGAEFDRLFAEKMSAGHAELVRIVENARPTLSNQDVRELVASTLPTLQHHRQVATRLDENPPD